MPRGKWNGSSLWRLTAALGCLCALPVGAAAGESRRVTGPPTALVGVHVVSMSPDDATRVRRRQTVLIENGRIVDIGPSSRIVVPPGMAVIDGRGKLYVLPGLTDLHAHTLGVTRGPRDLHPEDVYTLTLANGVTSLLDMGGSEKLFRWQREVARGKVLGPAWHFTSPIIDQADYPSLARLERDLRKWARRGYAYFKSHVFTDPDAFSFLHRVARELGVPVVGHALRPGFPIQTTLDQEPLMIAHVEEIFETSLSGPDDFESQLAGPLRAVVDSRVWVTTTVDVYEIVANTVDDGAFADLLSRPEMRYVPPDVRSAWELRNPFRDPGFRGDRDDWLFALGVKLYIVRELVRLGALDRLLLGTDAYGVPNIVPGFAVHDELRLLARAGLSPWQAIRLATSNAARFLGVADEVGTVEVGKRADLLVVRRNPLKRIGRLGRPAGVMVNGVWLPASELEARLEALAARWPE